MTRPSSSDDTTVVGSHGTTVVDPLLRQSHDGPLGKRLRKVDGAQKATGRTRYADDIVLPGMLACKIKRSTKAHARIVSIDAEKARAIPGVVDVVLGDELPELYGIIPWTRDETALAFGKVRHVGEAVAAVAAIDEWTAERACRLISVTYEDLPHVLSVDEARTSETKVNERAKVGNVTKHVALSFGDVEKGLTESDVVVDGEFVFHGTTHAAIEPHCAIGDYDVGRGILTVYSSTQVPHYLHRELAAVLGVASDRIRVVQPPVGGAFGGKSEPFDLEFVVARLSMKTGRPVKCLYTREEVFYAHRGRHPMRMHFTSGASKDGHLKAVRSNIDIDGGAYASFGMITAFYAGQLLTGPVGMDSYAFTATRYYTNKPACGPKRGHGSVQPRFAFEIQLDMLAEKLCMDPIEFRLRNVVEAHSQTVNGQAVGSLGLRQCLERVRAASSWDERRGRLPYGRGLGIASSMYISGTNYPIYPNEMPQSGAQIAVDRSGRVRVFTGASDIGQGSDSMAATIVAEELGVHVDSVVVVSGDTDLTPVDLGAYSSRVTLMMGHAVQEAARHLRRQIVSAVAAHFSVERTKSTATAEIVDAADVLLVDGRAFLRSDTGVSIPITQAFALAETKFGTLGATGGYRTKERGGDYRGGTIGASPAYSCTAHVAEVVVDVDTGRIHVEKVWVAHDCGTALNPIIVEGQIEGSTYMGVAEVSLENMLYGEDSVRRGMLVGPSLLDYRIPTSLDTPGIEAFVVEEPDRNGPYGAKEAGEGPLHSSIPAVANAIYDAVGVRLCSLPFTPSSVRDALRAHSAQRAGGR